MMLPAIVFSSAGKVEREARNSQLSRKFEGARKWAIFAFTSYTYATPSCRTANANLGIVVLQMISKYVVKNRPILWCDSIVNIS